MQLNAGKKVNDKNEDRYLFYSNIILDILEYITKLFYYLIYILSALFCLYGFILYIADTIFQWVHPVYKRM